MSEIRRGLFFSMVDRYAGFAISFISIMVLSRLLTPAETGLYSIAAAFINIAQSLRTFGVYTYILQEVELTTEKIGSAVGVSLVIACGLVVFFCLAAHPLAVFYKNSGLMPLIYILSMNFALVAYAAVGHGILTRHMRFRSIMTISIASSVANAVTSCSLALLHFGAVGLAWGSVAGIVVTIIGNAHALRVETPSRPNLKHWRRVFHFGIFSSFSGILGELSVRTPDLLIGRLISLEGVGLFSRGSGLVTSFGTLITGAAHTVSGSHFAKIHREEADLQGSYLQTLSYACIIVWPALGMLAVLSDPVIELCFGKQWLASVPISQVLCLGVGISLIGVFAQTLLAAIGAVREDLYIQLVAVPAYIASVAVGSTIGLTAAAVGSIVSGTIVSVLSAVILRRRIGLDTRALLRVLWPAIVATICTMAATFGVVMFVGLSPISILPAGIAGGLVWLATIHILRHPAKEEIWKIINYALHFTGLAKKTDVKS